ncbi:MAG TPA: hypothetical protein VFW28_17190 [Micropepsaceae bacterium]|nr:hypothetical protein [Micropepsaceae bacterium]
MPLRRDFLFYLIVAAWAAAPAIAQTAAVPDLSGTWQHPVFPWFEPPASGPGPVTNLSRWTQSPANSDGGPVLPAGVAGVSDYDQLVGDYRNPILQPWAADVVKHFGELSLKGVTYGNPSNQCWPMPMPFTFKNFVVEVMQQKDTVTLVYSSPQNEVRRIRLNAPHPNPLRPSWYGDSVGHYEGDTLVVDTVGVKTDRPYAMQDLFGTPYTDKLHIVERYRLRDYDDVKGAIERNKKENWMFAGDVWAKHRGKFLQVQVTVDDAGVFTAPFTATMTYVPNPDLLPESICAENPHEYYNNRDSDLPKADKPDF